MTSCNRRNPIAIKFPLLFFVTTMFWASATARAQTEKELIAKGQYIFEVAGGCACHTVPKETPHAGGRAFPIPFGTVHSTNITQDKETGLGNWSDEQIRDAMVKGIRPDGSRILPVMPYEAYSGMAQEDLKALIAYLRTLKPVKKATPPPNTWVPFLRGLGTPVYLMIFGRFSNSPLQAPRSGIDRGRYLADHVSLCGDCHTPRNFIGAPKRSLHLAGASKKNGPLGQEVPNITPDRETGIGDWKREDIVELLISGNKPDMDNVQGLMAEVIEHGYKNMTKENALAIADYLKSIAPIKNKIK
jgi:mono/diheme cytochrome c family protein